MPFFYERPPVFKAAAVKRNPESWDEVMSVLGLFADNVQFITQFDLGHRFIVTFEYKGERHEATEGSYVVRKPNDEIEVLESHEFKSRFISAEQ